MEETELEYRLLVCIQKEIRKEFRNVHLSYNLAKTMTITQLSNGHYELNIPARVYNIKKFRETGVVVYHTGGYYKGGQRSYAKRIDETGGFSGKHKGYIGRCIRDGIRNFIAQLDLNVNVRGLNGN